MGKFLLTDLGAVCLVFWGIIGAFLVWYVWKLKEFDPDHDSRDHLEDEGNVPLPLPLQALQQGETDSFSESLEAINPDQPTQ